MGRIVGIAGSTNRITLDGLRNYAVRLTGKQHPNILFLGTALHDPQRSMEGMARYTLSVGGKLRFLMLTKLTYTEQELDEAIAWADLIYVGGGDTVFMMGLWKELGLDRKFRKVFEEDTAVLSGISAGAICWFDCGHSDSESFHAEGSDWHFIFAEDMIGLLPGVFGPHYNEPGRTTLDTMLAQKPGMTAYAMENDTAYVVDGEKTCYISTREDAKAWKMVFTDGKLSKEPLPLERI